VQRHNVCRAQVRQPSRINVLHYFMSSDPKTFISTARALFCQV